MSQSLLESAKVEAIGTTKEGEAPNGGSRKADSPIQQGGTKMKRAAIYCRVSTDNQEKEGTSLDTHFSGAESGLTLDRPNLNKLREHVWNGEIDVVVVYCLDRVSRDPTHGVLLQEELEKHGVTLEAVTETIESTELGKLISYIRGFASKLEAEKIRERTMRGKKALVREGKYPQGCGFGVYGYDWEKEKKQRLPNEYESRVINRIFTMIAEGNTMTSIARMLNEQGIKTKGGGGRKWFRVTIERIINNKVYIGITTFCGTELPEVTPPIVDKELFEQANASLKRMKELRMGRPKRQYLLTGHIVCGDCGKPLVGTCIRPPYRYYLCSETYSREYKDKTCNALRIRANHIESVVWEKVKEALMNPDLLMAQIKALISSTQKQTNSLALDKEIAKLRRKLRGYKADERSLLSLFRHKEIDRDTLLDEINQLKEDREGDEQRLTELTQSKESLAELVNSEIKITEYCSNVARKLADCSYENKHLALDALQIKVVATKDDFQINGVLPIEVNSNMVATARLSPYWLSANHHSTAK
jgi:site-specific DNA recombinase